jgi:hypothetical protein
MRITVEAKNEVRAESLEASEKCLRLGKGS